MRHLPTGLALAVVMLAMPAHAEDTTTITPETLERARWIHQRLHVVREGDTPSPAATAMALQLERARGPQSRSKRALELMHRQVASRADEGCSWSAEYVIALDLERRQAPAAPLSHREQVVLAAIESNLVRTVAQPISCCLCASAGTCNDSIFCNGVETCSNAICSSGSPPVCSDGDACTGDFCNVATDTCDSTPLPPPVEVTQLDVAQAGGTTVADLSWSTVEGSAVTYNLYRGQMVDLFDLACYKQGIGETAYSDGGDLSTSGVHVFLVSAVECGESGLGDTSSGPRPTPTEVCP